MLLITFHIAAGLRDLYQPDRWKNYTLHIEPTIENTGYIRIYVIIVKVQYEAQRWRAIVTAYYGRRLV